MIEVKSENQKKWKIVTKPEGAQKSEKEKRKNCLNNDEKQLKCFVLSCQVLSGESF